MHTQQHTCMVNGLNFFHHDVNLVMINIFQINEYQLYSSYIYVTLCNSPFSITMQCTHLHIVVLL